HIRLWRTWRAFVLRHPTYCDAHPERNAIVHAGYLCADVPIASYTYRDASLQSEEFELIDISLSEDDELQREVSEEAAQLPALMAIDEIRDLFDQNSWPKQWENSCRIMSPVFFRNIYLGALGEEIGRHLLQWNLPEWSIVDVEENEYFEKFDARIRGTNIFVDFKHWSGPVRPKRDEIEHIKDKMSEVGATHALVCNLTNKGTAELDIDWAYGGRILQVPALVDVSQGCVIRKNIFAIGEWLKKVTR
ncbi:MAG: hypothetical protein IKG22_00280, partial [Atopobiaceae bacterium]|nr:hypothetical protein [Atopobiaceae bacterium]